jgi:hypothetical protein
MSYTLRAFLGIITNENVLAQDDDDDDGGLWTANHA